MKQFEQWQDQIARLFPEYKDKYGNGKDRVLSQTVTFQVTDACDLACIYCLSGDTLIRMADYSLKPIKDIQLGDKILGFDEYPEKGKQTKVRTSVVEQLFKRKAKAINVKFSNGESLTITKNHKVLTKRNSYNNKYDYCNIGDLKVGNKVFHLPIIDSHLNIQPPVIDDDYKIGYLIAMIQGDGSLKHYNRKNDGCDVFKFRIAVKDIEIINRCKQFLDDFNIPTYIKPFKVSTKYNLWQDAIFANTRYVYNTLNHLIDTNFHKNFSLSYYQGYLAGLYDAEGHISNERTIRICNTNFDIIQEAMMGLDLLQIPYIIELDKKGTKNHSVKYNIRIVDNLNAISSYRFIKSISPSLPRKSFEKFLNYSPLKKTEIVSIEELDEEIDVYNIGTSTHTYIANSVAVHNCYQIHKGKRSMSFETAKKYIDLIISGDKGFSDYINPQTSPGIIIEFIGGEPFLEIDLIDKICDYFTSQLIEKQHPWATKYMFSICSNGVSYFDERVQRFLRKWNGHISFSVTIDGNKELHDSCRVFPDGSPSYDLAVAAAKDWMSRGYQMGSKITIAPGNVTFFYDAIKHMIELGYTEINANCVYEKGWETKHAIVLYEEMKKVSDYFLEHNLDFDHEYYCSLFNANMFHPKDEDDLQNWCFKAGTQILTPNGNKNIEDLQIGDAVISGSGQIQYVEDVKTRYATETCKVKIAGMEPMYTTPEHPILVHISKKTWQWVNASKLKTNDEVAIYGDDEHLGTFIKTMPVEYSQPSEPYDVYNLTVSNEHTFVANGVIVHNCGGNGVMLSCDPDGYLFPCIRYMESSLGSDQEPYSIGHVDIGICQTECDKCRVECLKKINRRTQSTDECFNCPIAEGCSWCFKAGTLITTPDGFKEIQDIQVGDKVITGSGNIETVEKISSRYTDDTVLINATGLLPLYTTSEHPFWVRKFRRSGNNLIYESPQWVKASQIKKSDKIALFAKKFGDVHIDKYVAYIAGRYMGDGWKTCYQRGNCNSTEYHLCGNYNECNDIENYLQLAHIGYSKDNTKRTAQEYNIYLTNHKLTDNNELLISILSKSGQYSHGKYIPKEIFNWDKESIESFLKGYFDADGSYDKKRDVVKFTTVSLNLAQGISSLLLMFGKKCNWHVRHNSTNIINNRKVNTHCAYELSFLLREPRRKYYEFDADNNIMWVNVKEVNSNIDGYTVYNMSVSNEHTYLANGAIVHNCSAYNYQVFGTPDARATYICIMHKARALGNIYFWNKYYRQHGRQERMKMYIPDEWALEIINQNELNMLKELSKED